MTLPERVIIIHYNPFDTFSKVSVIENNVVLKPIYIHSVLRTGANEIINLCYQHNIFNIYFNGSDNFLSEFCDIVSNIEMDKYNINKIIIQGVIQDAE